MIRLFVLVLKLGLHCLRNAICPNTHACTIVIRVIFLTYNQVNIELCFNSLEKKIVKGSTDMFMKLIQSLNNIMASVLFQT